MTKANTMTKTAQFTAVKSSTIQSYAKEANALLVKFNNGTTYKYEGVSDKVITDFAAAASKGKFFAANIRNKFLAEKVA